MALNRSMGFSMKVGAALAASAVSPGGGGSPGGSGSAAQIHAKSRQLDPLISCRLFIPALTKQPLVGLHVRAYKNILGVCRRCLPGS